MPAFGASIREPLMRRIYADYSAILLQWLGSAHPATTIGPMAW